MRQLLLAVLCSFLGGQYCLAASLHAAQKFDEFGDICCEDEKARLDNFAVELRDNPEVQGYIIFYGGRRQRHPWCHSRLRLPRWGEAQARAERMKPYLVNLHGFDPKRIIMLNGGFRESFTAVFWIVPKDATPPTPTPTLERKDIKFRRGKVTTREYHLQCMEG